jgi:hypothetical protein
MSRWNLSAVFRDRRRQLGLKQVTAETRTTTRVILRPEFGVVLCVNSQ